MTIDARIADLLERYEDLQSQGRPVSPEELCRDCLELLEPFRQHLRQLQIVAPILESRSPGQAKTPGHSSLPSIPNTVALPTAAPGADTIPPAVGTGSERDFPAAGGVPIPAARQIPGYEILGELGRGGMGIVYRARQVKANRIVALKMILSGAHADVAELGRFRTEAEAIARLRHPYIVQVFEVGEHQGLPYFSLEFCEGGSLAKKIGGKPLPADETARIVEQISRAMFAAHTQQVIHRDLKPANVLLLADGTPKITDFGLAKKLDDSGQTRTGDIMGSPSYMAPEQASGRTKDIGPVTDVYSLGAILYECLTGRPPFIADTLAAVIDQVINAEPIPPSRLNPAAPRDLETICLKCLEKDPARRYDSPLRLAQDLERFRTGDAILARREGLPRKLWRKVRRHRVLVGASLGVLIALVVAGVFFLREGQVRRERDLDAQAETAVKEIDATVTSWDRAEERITDLASISPAKAAERTRELHEGIARWVRDQLGKDRLQPDEKQAINTAIDWLNRRDTDLAAGLDVIRKPRFSSPEEVFNLEPGSWNELPDVFDSRQVQKGAGDFLERVLPPEKSPTLIGLKKPCRYDVQFHVEFDGPFEPGSDLGLMLFAEDPLDDVVGVHYSVDGQTLLTVEGNGLVKAWSPASGRWLKDLGRTAGGPQVATGAAGNRLLVAWIERDTVVIQEWDSSTFKPGRTLRCPVAGAAALALNATCTLLGAMDREGTVSFWTLPEGKEQVPLKGPRGASPVLTLSADGEQVAAAQGGELVVWDLRRGKEPRRLQAGEGKVQALAFSPTGDRLAAGFDTKAVRLWDLVAGDAKPLHHLGIAVPVGALAFSPDGQSLAVLGMGEQFIFQGRDLRNRWKSHGKGRSVCFSRDGQLLATPARTDVAIRQAEDGKDCSRIGSQGYLFRVMVKPDRPGAASSLETIRQNGGTVQLQVLRNNLLLREEDRVLAAGSLILQASKEGERLRFQVNTTPEVTYRDVVPGAPRKGHYSVLWPGGRVQRLKADETKPPEGLPLEIGDNHFAEGRLAEALAYYQSQARSAAGKAMVRECECKAALCLDLLRNPAKAVQLFDRVARDDTAPPGEPWPLLAAFRLWAHHLGRGEFGLADNQYSRIGTLDPGFRHSTAIIPLADRQRIWDLYELGGGSDRYFFLSSDEMVRRRRIADLAEQFGMSLDHQLAAAFTLVTGLRATGQDGAALKHIDRLKSQIKPGSSTTNAFHSRLIWQWTWLLRLEKRYDEALQVLENCPPSSEGLMLVERCRVRTARGEFDLALKDLEQAKVKLLGQRVDYLTHSQLYLMEGFLHDRKGDKVAARRAWQRARFQNWGKEEFPEGDRLWLFNLGPLPLVFNWIASSLADELDDAEARGIVKRITEIVSDRPGLGTLAAQFGPTPEVVRRAWTTPRGKECAWQMTFQNVSFVEFIRLPMIALGAEYFLKGAFDGSVSKAQEDLVWKLSRDMADNFFRPDSPLKPGHGREILQLWSGLSGYREWPRLSGSLPEPLRGPLAYLLGRRSERNVQLGDAQLFFEAAARAGSPPGLRELANAELARLKKPSP